MDRNSEPVQDSSAGSLMMMVRPDFSVIEQRIFAVRPPSNVASVISAVMAHLSSPRRIRSRRPEPLSSVESERPV